MHLNKEAVRDEGEGYLCCCDGGVVEEVQQFCYLCDVLHSEDGVGKAVRARVAAAWGEWREISGLLINQGIPVTQRGKVIIACILSVFAAWSRNVGIDNVI